VGHELLLPGEGESGFETIEMASESSVSDTIVGTQVLLIRR
jgi:hypothetical protein